MISFAHDNDLIIAEPEPDTASAAPAALSTDC